MSFPQIDLKKEVADLCDKYNVNADGFLEDLKWDMSWFDDLFVPTENYAQMLLELYEYRILEASGRINKIL